MNPMDGAPNPGGTESTDSAILAALATTHKDRILRQVTHAGQSAVYVQREDALPLLEHLRDEHSFTVLIDVTALDFLNRDTPAAPERFQVVYVLQRRQPTMEYFRVNAWVPEEDPSIASAYELWRSAKWGERECHDMFGIVFEGNPDLRRFLMPEDYPAFPLLKDYPLAGRDERRQFPRIVPEGDEMKVKDPEPYPTSIGRGMHTPEYLEEIKRDSKPKPRP